MEIKRKQTALRKRFWFRMGVCVASVLGSALYLFFNNNSALWGVLIGICGSALVWALVELFDFFVQTFNQYETERNAFGRIRVSCFEKIKDIIRTNPDDIPMQDIKACTVELYNKVNDFIFSNSLYPISDEFEKCINYLNRMFWKFDSCCSGIFDDCEEKTACYKKMQECLIEEKTEQQKTSGRFFRVMSLRKTIAEMTDIDLSFDKYEVPEGVVEKGVTGNLGESFAIPGNIRTTTTFKPDVAFWDLYQQNNNRMIRCVLSLIFRKVSID